MSKTLITQKQIDKICNILDKGDTVELKRVRGEVEIIEIRRRKIDIDTALD